MIDPFINEKSKNKNNIQDINENCNNLVYAESRYESKKSPKIIYIPNVDVMFKIIRSCFGVAKKEDLWIFNLN